MCRLTLFLGLILFVLATSGHKGAERQVTKDDGKIIGGKEIDITNFPYIVSLQFIRNGRHFCGGSIISPDYILTAAHCVREDQIPADRIQIVAGTTNLKNETEDTIKSKVKRIINHPKYNATTRNYDVALLQLETPCNLEGNTKAIELDHEEFRLPDHLITAGWGVTTDKSKEPSDILMVTAISGVPRDMCRKRYKNSKTVITRNMICASSGEAGTDVCRGDSGGPAVSLNTKKQVGIISWGKRSCARPNSISVYANVPRFIPWIEKETGLSL